MKYRLVNDGEPDENGEIVAVIESRDGAPSTVVKAKSEREMIKTLLKAQVNANSIIARLKRPDKAKTPDAINMKPQYLTPTDKLRLATEITDPDKVVDAVTEIVTAAQDGVTPREAVQGVASMTEAQRNAYWRAEADAFNKANPDYYPVEQNMAKLFAALDANKFDFTRNNLGIVYQALEDQGELIAWPTEERENDTPATADEPNGKMREEPSPEPNPPSPTQSRPRSVATGLRGSDASAAPPPPPTPKRLTRADIERMPRREYMERLSDPGFRKAVDALGA